MFLFLRLLILIIFAIGNTFIKIVLVQKRIKKIISFTCNFKFLGNYFSISVFDFIVIFFSFRLKKSFLYFLFLLCIAVIPYCHYPLVVSNECNFIFIQLTMHVLRCDIRERFDWLLQQIRMKTIQNTFYIRNTCVNLVNVRVSRFHLYWQIFTYVFFAQNINFHSGFIL